MPSCTNIECAVPVRWDDRFGDGLWVHTTTRERKCPGSGLTPPFSQRRQRPAERSWSCPECRSWIPAVEDGHGRLSASCIGPALRPHPETSWAQPLSQTAEPDAGVPEVRLSPDARLVAIKAGDKRWRVSDGSHRPDQRVQDWQVLPYPRPEAEPEPSGPCDPEAIEYGIEYHYSPGRWHVLPNITFTDPVTAAKGVLQRNKAHGAEDYRLVQRKAAGMWEPLDLPVG